MDTLILMAFSQTTREGEAEGDMSDLLMEWLIRERRTKFTIQTLLFHGKSVNAGKLFIYLEGIQA